MKCSDFAKQILKHIEEYGDGEIYMSVDREAPGLIRQGADALAVDQRYVQEDVIGCNCACPVCNGCAGGF